jgi:hypothetical protein
MCRYSDQISLHSLLTEPMTRTSARFLLLLLLVAGYASWPGDAAAQRFGLGFNALLSTEDGFGIGLRGRASAPINADLSIGIDVGASGFVLGGRRDADWVFDPQLSVIITPPATSRTAPYYLAGVGAYLPLSEDDTAKGGPTIHGGIGWVHLLSETTFFYEINPALVIAEERVHLALPIRAGIIF